MSDDAPIPRATDDPRAGLRTMRPFARPGGSGRPNADAPSGTPVSGPVSTPFVRPVTAPARVSDADAGLAQGPGAPGLRGREGAGVPSGELPLSLAPLLGRGAIAATLDMGEPSDTEPPSPRAHVSAGQQHDVADLLVRIAERVRRREVRLPSHFAPASEAAALAAVLAALLLDAQPPAGQVPAPDRDPRARTEL